MTSSTRPHPYLRSGRADVLAHRGASHACPPGNTWAAFARAIEVGVDHIETDVQATRDGRVVVFHDERLDELTTGSGRIGDHSWSELESLRYVADGDPTDDGLVLLDDLLSTHPETYFNIDIKTDETVEPAIRILRSHSVHDRVCIAAFGWRRLRRLRRELGPHWCSAYSRMEIVAARTAAWLRLPVPRFGDVVQAPREQKSATVIDRRFVDACHRRGIHVHVWTVNERDEVRRLRDLGVDALITDRPDAVLDVLG